MWYTRAYANTSKQSIARKTLESILTSLVDMYGWEELGTRIKINCFVSDPSIKSSLVFLRRTPWARAKVEDLYVQSLPKPRRR